MLNKIIIILVLYSTFGVAQNNTYRTDNFTTWKVVNANVENKYLVLQAKSEKLLKEFKPICTSAKLWVFRYEMMGIDDSFYDKNSRPNNLETIVESSAYTVKIDIEKDNFEGTNSVSIQKICADNQADRYFDLHGTNNEHGIITYVGDISISPPF